MADGASSERRLAANALQDGDNDGLSVLARRRRLHIHVGLSSPNIWRSEPYYSHIRTWAYRGLRAQTHMTRVTVGKHDYIVLPDREVDVSAYVGRQNIQVKVVGPGQWTVLHYEND